jgi:hypothetical protein
MGRKIFEFSSRSTQTLDNHVTSTRLDTDLFNQLNLELVPIEAREVNHGRQSRGA